MLLLILVLVALNVLDATTTLYALKHSLAVEGNPIMAFCLSAGTGWFLLAKFSLIGLGALIVWLASASNRSAVRKTLTTLNIVYAFIVVWNVVNILIFSY